MAGIDFPWKRHIKLTFSGEGAGTFESTGKQDQLRITCHIQKTLNSLPGASNIMIYNLTPDTRSKFQQYKTKVTVEAGWDEGPRPKLAKCFSGTLLSSESVRAGEDIVTTLKAISGLSDVVTETVSKEYKPGTPVESVIRELAGMLPGVTIGAIVGIDGVIPERGWSFVGTVMEGLNKLKKDSFNWTIDDDVFRAVKDDRMHGGSSAIQDPWLISVNPILSGPGQVTTGVKIKSVFDSSIAPQQEVELKSKISTKYNRKGYRVNYLTHNLDCFTSNSFTTDIVAYTLLGGA